MIKAQSVIVTLPEGDRLTDLHGIANDLRACRDYILLFKTLCFLKVSHLIHQLADCVVTTIFIRYGRCFSGGVRLKTQKELKLVMSSEDLKVHQLVMDFRDKHFAHSVNQCESPEINVWLKIGSEDQEATSVGAASTNMIAPNQMVFDNLLILIDKLHSWVLSEQKKESEMLLQIVRQRFSLDSLYARLGGNPNKKMCFGDVAKSRKKQ